MKSIIRQQHLNITNVKVPVSYYGFIFKTTFSHGKIYIGQTISRVYANQNGGMRQCSLGYFGSGITMKKAVKKYGKQDLIREILIFCNSQASLDRYEKVFIIKFKSTNSKIGYNISKGAVLGQVGRLNPSCNPVIRNKISKTLKGRMSGINNPHFGKKHTKEQKRKWSTERKKQFKNNNITSSQREKFLKQS